ncbi:sugar phosphorylase [Leptolyngbya sp. PCC 6406]|uniref:sugar phosphorylase n=1 Tax=Leptolyngbya sp. PCC 6406 TaxID=1173264 RepID=UPI0002ABDDAB|nr:sugar phosphorylase [Leptolyngbya sp. PCC 6406]
MGIEVKNQYDLFASRVNPLLSRVYAADIVNELTEKLFGLLLPSLQQGSREDLRKWDHDNILLITYGDSIQSQDGRPPLAVLAEFLETHLQDTVTGVHILPFFPYSSDDGFAIIDYTQVNPTLGDWSDIKRIAQSFNLMVDLVINHISSQHVWVKQFQAGEKPGRDYLIETDPEQDLTQVVRPRSSPLLTQLQTAQGPKYVWSTFSADQIDVNFANPDVLLEFVKIILLYVEAGARYLRLDAVGYLWKKLDTSCIHLAETHAIVRLLREILQMLDPSVAIITETNVPNRENLSYFGNRNEAHMIYNFSLPPLLLNALMQGKAEHLKTWMMSMPPAPIGCAYFNFTASHDGIGMRPAEGLLTPTEYTALVDTMRRFGGHVSMRSRPDGSESPYEINISLFDAMAGTVAGEDEWQIQRFLCSQTIMMSLEGIPAFYIHSLLATRNYQAGVEATGHNRTINRYKWDIDVLEAALADDTSPHAIVLKELGRLIRIRRRQRAFHPNATQYTLHPLNPALFAFWRQSMARDQSIFCIHNLSKYPQELQLSDLNLVNTDDWVDLISRDRVEYIDNAYTILQPYQSLWITNKVDSARDRTTPDPLIGNY